MSCYAAPSTPYNSASLPPIGKLARCTVGCFVFGKGGLSIQRTPPLMEVRSVWLVAAHPRRLRILDDYIEVTPARDPSGRSCERARYEQIVQVKLHRGFFFDLIIETKGSRILSVLSRRTSSTRMVTRMSSNITPPTNRMFSHPLTTHVLAVPLPEVARRKVRTFGRPCWRP